MQLQDLLEQVRQRREARQLEKESVAEEQRAIEAERIRNLLVAFQDLVQKHFGDVLEALNADKSFHYQSGDLKCTFQVKHAIVAIAISERDVQGKRTNLIAAMSERHVQGKCTDISVGISAAVTEGYFSSLQTLQDSYRAAWLYPNKALDFLQELIFDICEEYDLLAPEFEAAAAKLAQKETVERLIDEYRQAIKAGVEKSDREITVLNTVQKEWEWPHNNQLQLHKIIWQKHGFVDSQGNEHFDYESGWSLSDLPASFEGYFDLLPEQSKSTRAVKPRYLVSVERYYFTEDTLPKELLEKPTQKLEVVKVYDCIREASFRLLPQFVPVLPPEIADKFAIEPAIAIFDLAVPPKPCLPIRLALADLDRTNDDSGF